MIWLAFNVTTTAMTIVIVVVKYTRDRKAEIAFGRTGFSFYDPTLENSENLWLLLITYYVSV